MVTGGRRRRPDPLQRPSVPAEIIGHAVWLYSAFRSGCAWSRSCWPRAASSSATNPTAVGAQIRPRFANQIRRRVGWCDSFLPPDSWPRSLPEMMTRGGGVCFSTACAGAELGSDESGKMKQLKSAGQAQRFSQPTIRSAISSTSGAITPLPPSTETFRRLRHLGLGSRVCGVAAHDLEPQLTTRRVSLLRERRIIDSVSRRWRQRRDPRRLHYLGTGCDEAVDAILDLMYAKAPSRGHAARDAHHPVLSSVVSKISEMSVCVLVAYPSSRPVSCGLEIRNRSLVIKIALVSSPVLIWSTTRQNTRTARPHC